MKTTFGQILEQRVIRANACVVMVVCLFLPLGGCDSEKAQEKTETKYEIEKEFVRGPLTVHMKVEKSEITIADTIWLQLEAVIDEKYKVEMPSLADVLGEYEFGILDYKSLPDELTKDNRLSQRRMYRLEPILSGTYSIPSLKFVFRGKKQSAGDTEEVKQYELNTKKIDIEVKSLLAEDRSVLAIADIKHIAELPRAKSKWWMWGGGAVVLAGIVVGLIVLLRARREKRVRILKPAHEVAYQRLEKLLADDLIKGGRIKEFYERISDILRHYIEHRFELRAPEYTTEEFLYKAGMTDVLNNDHRELLREFLNHCDLVKFARYGPTADEIQRTFDITKEFIEATRVQEKQVDVTDEKLQPSDELVRSA